MGFISVEENKERYTATHCYGIDDYVDVPQAAMSLDADSPKDNDQR